MNPLEKLFPVIATDLEVTEAGGEDEFYWAFLSGKGINPEGLTYRVKLKTENGERLFRLKYPIDSMSQPRNLRSYLKITEVHQ